MASVYELTHHLVDTIWRGRLGGAIGLVTEKFAGRNLYIDFLAWRRSEDGLIPVESHGVTLYLDPEDAGLSRELLIYGTREEVATRHFRRELKTLRDTSVPPITVLEIGANKGYYAFQIADILRDRGEIYAVEPEPENVSSLRRGISSNGFDNITIDAVALGNEDGVFEMYVSEWSNSHTLNHNLPSNHERYTGTIEVEVISVTSFLDMHGLVPSDVDVVRMDVEGFEPEIVDGLTPVFESGGPELLFVELHPHRVETDRLHAIIDMIESHGMELVMASSPVERSLAGYEAVRNHVDTNDGMHSTELIVKR